jgi:hypothetical protein
MSFVTPSLLSSLMCHANSSITMDICTHAVSSKKRRAQAKVVEMILPEGKKAVGKEGPLNMYLFVYHAILSKVS